MASWIGRVLIGIQNTLFSRAWAWKLEGMAHYTKVQFQFYCFDLGLQGYNSSCAFTTTLGHGQQI